jgi:hypothetical protein
MPGSTVRQQADEPVTCDGLVVEPGDGDGDAEEYPGGMQALDGLTHVCVCAGATAQIGFCLEAFYAEHRDHMTLSLQARDNRSSSR